MLPLDLNHLSMLSVSVFFICPCCMAPGDPISIFLIPGDYISMLDCRIGTELLRAFPLPILTPISHHITLSWLVLLLPPQSLCWAYSPELLHPVSLRAYSQDSGQTQIPSGRSHLTALTCGSKGQAIAAQGFCDRALLPSLVVRADSCHFDICILIWTHACLFFVVITYQSCNYILQLLSDLSIGKKDSCSIALLQ